MRSGAIILLILYGIIARAQNTIKTETKMDTATQPKMQVEVWSDMMCPFCYIGKRHYEEAISKFADSNDVEIVWKSFQLDPDAPERYDKSVNDYLAERKGINIQQAEMMNNRVTQMAKDAGLTYHFDKAIIANSEKAHRIVQLAKTKGLDDAVEERFFRAYFTEGKDLSDKQTLISLGKEVGLTEADVNEALTNDEYAYRFKQDVAEAQSIGVSGVPFFVFNRRYAVSGAQPTETFLKTLQQSFAEWRKANPIAELKVTSGNVCMPNGGCE